MLIDACKKYLDICGYRCCHFEDNYIVLYPDELSTTRLSTSHLNIIDEDYHGGKKAVCTRRCSPEDYKPFDCRVYPYFLVMLENGKIQFLKGAKCPLKKEELMDHKKNCINEFKRLVKKKIFINGKKI